MPMVPLPHELAHLGVALPHHLQGQEQRRTTSRTQNLTPLSHRSPQLALQAWAPGCPRHQNLEEVLEAQANAGEQLEAHVPKLLMPSLTECVSIAMQGVRAK